MNRDTLAAPVATRAAARLGSSLLLALALHPGLALAEPRPVSARVVWAEGARAWVLVEDSLATTPGTRLEFLDRRRTIASGLVESVMDARMTSVRLTAGSLAKVRHLERLSVRAEPPAPRAIGRLRVGIPAGTRGNLAVNCEEGNVAWPGGDGGWRVEALGRDAWRGLRDPATTAVAWPETLDVRRFRDATDEEIAIQRGELDAAVFWPGEVSARLREHPGELQLRLATRSRGVIASIDPGGEADTARSRQIAARLAGLNRDLFGGDLLAWSPADSGTSAPPGSDAASLPAGPAAVPPAFTANPSLPGRGTIEQYLNGGAALFQRGKPAPVQVTAVDVPRAEAADLAPGWRRRGIVTRYAIRCAVLLGPSVPAPLRATDPAWLADLPACRVTETRP